MRKEILKLREQGKTYNEIVSILGCSKSTVSYHCGENQKEKTLERNKKYSITEKGALIKKLEKAFKRKVHDNLKYRSYIENGVFTYDKEGKDEFIENCIKNPICYITKLPIDLSKTKSYEIDHIIPVSKGGSNSFDNLAICLRNANRMKADLLLEELYDLCEIILSNR